MSAAKYYPNRYARIGGIVYLIIIVAGLFGEMFARNAIVVSGNAAATASHLSNSPLIWRIGIAGDLIMHVCDVLLMMILYILLRPVSRNLALLALLFNLVQTAVLVANKLNLLMPLFLLGDADYLKAFDSHQLEAWSYLSIKSHAYGFGIGLIYFGFACLVYGFLIYKSTYLPRVIGVMMILAGFCYILNIFALIIDPEFANKLYPMILAPAFIGELSLCLWLLFKGVNLEKWSLVNSH